MARKKNNYKNITKFFYKELPSIHETENIKKFAKHKAPKKLFRPLCIRFLI